MGAKSLPEHFDRFWRYMQRIELCRHRAEMAEQRSEDGSDAFRSEMAAIAREWRDLALAIEQSEQPLTYQADAKAA